MSVLIIVSPGLLKNQKSKIDLSENNYLASFELFSYMLHESLKIASYFGTKMLISLLDKNIIKFAF